MINKKYLWAVLTLFRRWTWGKIGEKCYIGPTCYTRNTKRIFIGDRVRIYPGSRLEVNDQQASITLGDDISCGQNLHIISGEDLQIGANTTISANVFISNIDHTFTELNRHIMDQPLKISATTIGCNCFIGYGAAILPGSKIGKHCIIGANSVVKGSFPDYSVIAGAPAKIVKRYNFKSSQWQHTNSNGIFTNEA